MSRVFVVCLLLQAVFCETNVSISVGSKNDSPADVTYVQGKAPEDLKAGPLKKNSTDASVRIASAAFIRSSTRDIPKDDEIENEEFERFIKEHHSRPTIETVFVSTSPSPLINEESEELNAKYSSTRSQAEFFKRPAEYRTFERSVALPTVSSSVHSLLEHQPTYSFVQHQPNEAFINLGNGVSYHGNDGAILQTGGSGHYSTIANGHYIPNYQDVHADGGYQQFYHAVPTYQVPGHGTVPRTINVAQQAVKTKTFEIRRPAIQKHYYDIEERVIVRPAGSIVVELDRPVAKIPKGETIVGLGGLQGEFVGSGVSHRGFRGVNFQQSQGAQGFSGNSGGIIYTTSPGSYYPADTQATPVPFGGGPQGGLVGVGFQQSQGAIGVSQSGVSGIGIQQSQGTVGVTQGGSSQGVISRSGIQQSQGGVSISTTTTTSIPNSSNGGSQGGIIYSTSGPPYLPPISSTPSVAIGGGFQQSQGAIGVSQAGSQGGVIGVGIQQQQGAVGVSQGGVATAGVQQSQGVSFSTTTAPSIAIGGSHGGIAGGIGFQQSQGAIGAVQGSGAFANGGFQQSQGGISFSTTTAPFIPPVTPTPTLAVGGAHAGVVTSGYPQYPVQGSGDSVIVEANTNVQNRGTFATKTTTERSFSSSVSQDASAYARGSSSGSRTITPYMITVGEPNFQYPPYVEINSHGSPLGHLQQSPYAQIQAKNQAYPRMRYQGRLLIGEVQDNDGSTQLQESGYGALSQNSAGENIYESQARVAEIPPDTPEVSQPNTQNQYQVLGSTQQSIQVSQATGSAHQQPAQVHQHHFVSTTPRSVRVTEIQNQGGYHEAAQQPISTAYYRSRGNIPTPSAEAIQQHFAQVHELQQRHHSPNLVAQIHHQQQHSAQVRQQSNDQQLRDSYSQPQTDAQRSSEPSNVQYQQQVSSTTQIPESLVTGRRLYQQRNVPVKYTQHHTINVAPSQHTILFRNQPRQLQESSGRSQNLEIPPETETDGEISSLRSTSVDSSTTAAIISSTTPAPSRREPESAPRTYASVLANGQPGILYASADLNVQHPQSRPTQQIQRPQSGRQFRIVYAQPSRVASTNGQLDKHKISLSNEGLEAEIPISSQKQIQLKANSNSASDNEQQKSTSQSQTSAISSTIQPSTDPNASLRSRGLHRYNNEQTHGALTLRSGRTYGDHRVIASTPAPSDNSAASESVQTRRIVVNHPFQTVQEVVEQEPFTKIHQVTVNEPAPVQAHSDGPHQVQQKAAYRHPAAYKVAATYDHPAATLSYHHGGSH